MGLIVCRCRLIDVRYSWTLMKKVVHVAVGTGAIAYECAILQGILARYNWTQYGDDDTQLITVELVYWGRHWWERYKFCWVECRLIRYSWMQLKWWRYWWCCGRVVVVWRCYTLLIREFPDSRMACWVDPGISRFENGLLSWSGNLRIQEWLNVFDSEFPDLTMTSRFPDLIVSKQINSHTQMNILQ